MFGRKNFKLEFALRFKKKILRQNVSRQMRYFIKGEAWVGLLFSFYSRNEGDPDGLLVYLHLSRRLSLLDLDKMLRFDLRELGFCVKMVQFFFL